MGEDILEINFPENDEKTWQEHCDGDFASIWNAFTCWLSMPILKRHYLESVLTKRIFNLFQNV